MKTLSIILIGMCIGGSVVKLVPDQWNGLSIDGNIVIPHLGEAVSPQAQFCYMSDKKVDDTDTVRPCLYADTMNNLMRLPKDLIKFEEENTPITIPVATSSIFIK